MIKIFLKRNYTFIAVLCCSVFLLSACASAARTEDNIEQRAISRWNALLSDDFATAYEFLSPGFRSSVSSAQYQRSLLRKRVKWTGARYVESNCTETTCKVKISLDYTLYGALPGVKSFDGTQSIEESWVQVDGMWYFVPEK